MIDLARVTHGAPDRVRVPRIGEFDLEALRMRIKQPAEIFLGARTREVVEDEHALALVEQAVGEVDADEAGASSDDYRRRRLGGALPDRLRFERVANRVQAA